MSAFATQKTPCKGVAELAAYNSYKAQFGNSIVFTKTTSKAFVEGNTITQAVQIIDGENGSTENYNVILDKNNCQILSVE
jgi:hypothetical protein